MDTKARTAAAILTDDQRREALEEIKAQRTEFLLAIEDLREELKTLDAMEAGHREALEKGTAQPELNEREEVSRLTPGGPLFLDKFDLMADLPPSWSDAVDEMKVEGAKSPEEWEAEARARADRELN
jgi:hypothetical protein